MEIIYDIIIYNVPNVLQSRERLLERLNDRAREEGISRMLLCHVVPGEKNSPGHAFASCEDLGDNSLLLNWSGMYFADHRLRFERRRTCRLDWNRLVDSVERWRRYQRKEATMARTDSWDDFGSQEGFGGARLVVDEVGGEVANDLRPEGCNPNQSGVSEDA